DSFIPLSRRLRIGALALCVAVTAAALVVVVPVSPTARPTSVQLAATIALVLVWTACVAEPIVRLWAASRGRPAVQRARLRALGGGYAAIVIILLVSVFGGSAVANPFVQWLFEVVAIIALPLLYVGFAPRGPRRSTATAGHQRVGSGERDSASPPARRRDRRHGSGLRSIYALLRYRRGQSLAGVRHEHHGRARPRPGDRTAGRPREDQEPVPEPGLARAAQPAGGDQRLPLDAGAGCVRSAQGIRDARPGGVESQNRRDEFAGGADARCGASRGWTAGVET